MNIFGQLKKACLEILSSQPSSSTQGRVWYNSTTGKNEFDNGTQKRALLANDDKAVIGNSGTAAENVRLNRAGAGVIQYVPGNDATAEGSLASSLAQSSSRVENYTDAGKPTFGNTGRLAYITDIFQLGLDIGTSWKYLADTNTAQTLTNKTINASNNTISNITNAMVNSGVAANGQALTADGSGNAAWVTPGKALVFNPAAKTANYTVLTTDQYLLGDSSAGAFTFSLYTPVGHLGEVVEFKKTDSSFNQISVTGTGFSSFLSTQDDTLQVISNGTTWEKKSRSYKSELGNLGSITLTGSITNPTKGTTTVDRIIGSRIGNKIRLKYEYAHGAAGTAGSGGYTVSIPSGLTIDTTKIPASATFVVASLSGQASANCGFGFFGQNSSNHGAARPYVFDSTKIAAELEVSATSVDYWKSTYYAFNVANFGFSMTVEVPILNWEE